jgi:hypothetical protein
MGGSIDLQSGVGSCAIVSYTRFPGSEAPGLGPCPGLPVSLGPPPPGYFLFLLIPLAATAVGGILAARRGGARSSGSGAAIGAAAGVAFAAAFAGWCTVARVTADVSGPIGALVPGLGVAIGPSPVVGFLLALAWGAAGGAAGGWWEGRRRAAGPAEAGPARDDRIA